MVDDFTGSKDLQRTVAFGKDSRNNDDDDDDDNNNNNNNNKSNAFW
jgi:hypothetical protein